MRILVTGATGLIGKKLCRHLIQKQHELVVLSRQEESSFKKKFSLPCKYYQWTKPDSELPPIKAFEDVDAVIHLIGESIAGKRWTKERKESIYNSRVKSSQHIAQIIAELERPPKVVIAASAIGYYGSTGDEIIDESKKPKGQDFIAMVGKDWEAAWDSIKGRTHTRLVILRIGVVLSLFSGFLGRLQSIFDLNMGGPIGNGKQWISWIHVQDLVHLIEFCLNNKDANGPLNAVTPNPITNSEFTRTFSKALKKWALFPVPGIILKLLMGEMSVLALGSQRIISRKAMDLGFQYKYGELEDALQDLYSWRKSSNDHMFEAEQWLDKPVKDVFQFFSNEKNLELITPPWLNFQILGKSTPEITENTLLDYKLRVRGLPMKWQSRINDWKPEKHFIDSQQRGPYSKWVHTHRFEKLSRGTLLKDHVVYQVPGKFLGYLFLSGIVHRHVSKIFAYRMEYIDRQFAS
jgi:uncharacterized protein (TIGR01777 family)